MRNAVLLLLLVGLLRAVAGAPQWTHSVQLSPDFALFWSPDEQTISFKVEVRTLGFVGLGFSPNGGMAHADIVMVWVDDTTGQAHIGDYHATHNGIPRRDEFQDVELLGAEQNGTHTIARFRRKWMTCDQFYDMILGEDTVRLIWAFGPKDPVNGVDPVTWHGKQYRGTRSVYLKDKEVPKKKKAHHQRAVRHWDVKMSNLLIPDNMDTRYWCKIFKLPALGKKHHMIGYTPLIDPRNKGAVHHMILYECVHSKAHDLFARYVAHDGAACYSPKMPVDWENCLTPIVAWAVGSEGEFLPEHVGLPLSDTIYPNHDTFFMLEVHYDNPSFKNSRDNSGIRVHFTEELRQYDGGVMTVGIAVTPLHLIPPRQPSYATAGYCTDECTAKMLPETGIKAVSVVLHSHLAGRNMRLRHIRNGRELPPIIEDAHYDFNYQQARVLKQEVSILQGDEMIMECGYETTNRTEPTFGGYSTKEEMCLAFVLHYPQTALAGCYSMTPVESFFNNLGVKEFYNIDMADIKKMLLHTRDEDNIWRPKPSPVTPPSPGTPFPDFPFEGGHIDDEANQKAIMALKNMKQFTIEPVDGAGDATGIFDGLRIRLPQEFQNRTFLDHLIDLPWAEKLLTQRIEESFYKGQHLTFCRRKDDALAFLPKIRSFPNLTHLHQPIEQIRDVNCPVRRGHQLSRYSPNSSQWHQPILSYLVFGICAALFLH